MGSGARGRRRAPRGSVRGERACGAQAAGGAHASRRAVAAVVRARAAASRSPRGRGALGARRWRRHFPAPALGVLREPTADERTRRRESHGGAGTPPSACRRCRPARPLGRIGPRTGAETGAGARGGRWARAEPRPEPAGRGRR